MIDDVLEDHLSASIFFLDLYLFCAISPESHDGISRASDDGILVLADCQGPDLFRPSVLR